MVGDVSIDYDLFNKITNNNIIIGDNIVNDDINLQHVNIDETIFKNTIPDNVKFTDSCNVHTKIHGSVKITEELIEKYIIKHKKYFVKIIKSYKHDSRIPRDY